MVIGDDVPVGGNHEAGAQGLGLAGFAATPNILLIVGDDMGYADVGFNGCKDIPTPNIDALAKQSVRCVNGYVSHPFCSPTRAGLMTGRYQQRFGHENNPAWLPESTVAGLPLSETTLPQVLKTAGYFTGAIGTVIFIAYLSALCQSPLHTATQFALLTALSAVGRTYLSAGAGFVAERAGWPMFFIVSAVAAIPSMLLLWWLQTRGHFATLGPAKVVAADD